MIEIKHIENNSRVRFSTMAALTFNMKINKRPALAGDAVDGRVFELIISTQTEVCEAGVVL